MIYFADLHVHSRFSMATARDTSLPEMARWAALKGLKVLATGDFTHPGWSSEIHEMLEEAENGLFRLKSDYVPNTSILPGGFGPADVRFVLNVEISSIYKKGGAVRKVHNLVFIPDFDSMDRFNARLDRIGNIRSDGRPILGLDCRHLLEIALEITPDSFLIPAHVWTPWFSILGSKSGFDSVEECFEDLAHHIFALETGLSSDPEMNYRVRSLDEFTLVSNSDIHSPSKLGREANIFTGTPGYMTVRNAIRAGGRAARMRCQDSMEIGSTHLLEMLDDGSNSFVGTIEFFPEEGKYHLDGHRKCSTRLSPEQTESLDGKCPVCGHRVTIGVMNRVNELGDRAPGEIPDRASLFWRLVPLTEIVAQALGVGPQSKKVSAAYYDLLAKLGPELSILWLLPLDEIGRKASPIIEEAIKRVRQGKLSIQAGYDGEYGKVELFGAGERHHFAGQDSWIAASSPAGRVPKRSTRTGRTRKRSRTPNEEKTEDTHPALNEEQQLASRILDRPVLVQAGPGTGKTRTLTHRIAFLVEEAGVRPEQITAVTFTRKAALEMQERLRRLLPEAVSQGCWVGTFHQLGQRILAAAAAGHTRTVLDQYESLELFKSAVKECNLEGISASVSDLFAEMSLLKQNLTPPEGLIPEPGLARVYEAYQTKLRANSALDLDDLLVLPVELLREQPALAAQLSRSWAGHLLVDEFQDVNRAQYELLRLLLPDGGPNLFAIGDPDQAIYGFRGADRNLFFGLGSDFPTLRHIRLHRNYRCQANILAASAQMLQNNCDATPLTGENGKRLPVRLVTLPNPALEGKFIVRTIEQLMGGSSFFSLDAGRSSGKTGTLGFKDFAIVYRLNAVADAIEQECATAGIPYQRSRKQKPEEEAEEVDPRAEAVTLVTMHASKGLEFPVVFVAGCEDGVIPYCPPDEARKRPYDPDEDRRLLYVAMTRAGTELFMTRCQRRTLFGRALENPVSRFLTSLDRSLCEFKSPISPRGGREGRAPVQGELFG